MQGENVRRGRWVHWVAGLSHGQFARADAKQPSLSPQRCTSSPKLSANCATARHPPNCLFDHHTLPLSASRSQPTLPRLVAASSASGYPTTVSIIDSLEHATNWTA